MVTTREVDVLVLGAGPGGMAAAAAAARAGCQVTVLDDNPRAGGQIWRSGVAAPAHGKGLEERQRRKAFEVLQTSGAEILPHHRVFAAPQPGRVDALVESPAGPVQVAAFRYRKLVLATGARELFLPFPGWTLPGVFGVGGLQALVTGGFPVAGKRVVVAGSGPLLLAVAAHLRGFGAEIVTIAEQASLRQLLPFSTALLGSPGKIVQGAQYRLALRKTRFRTGCWPVEAVAGAGVGQLSAVRLTDGRRTWSEACDLLACGFHLVPNTELPQLLGCALDGDLVQVDDRQQTSVPNVFCVGEPTGIAGVDAAQIQGEAAGMACGGRESRHLEGRARRSRRFGRALARAFALRSELRMLPSPETIVCRCEDVPFRAFTGRSGWTDAKLQSRCGMGPCQARVCGPAVHFLLGWKNASIRPPLFPVPLHALTEELTSLEEIV